MIVGEELKRLNALQQTASTADELKYLIDEYSALLNTVPEDPVITFLLATANMQYGYNGVAIALFKRVLYYHPDFHECWNNLGSSWKAEHENDKALECFLKAVQYADEKDHKVLSDYFNNLTTLYINTGDPKPGLPYAEKAVELNPDSPKAHWNMGLVLLEMEQWDRGFQEMDAGLLSGDRPLRFFAQDPEKIPWWEGQEDGKIIVYGEQGMGDEILFASCMNDLIDEVGKDRVIYECHPRMENLFKRSFDVEVVPTRKKMEITWPMDRDDIGYKIAIGSLMHRYRMNGDFPKTAYLTPDSEMVEDYQNMLQEWGKGPFIGIGYAGGNKRTSSHERSYKLKELLPILEQDATFISLQYTKGAKEKWDRFYDDTGIRVHHWDDVVRGFDYDESVALMAALDLVIVPNTTAVHVCGAIGQDCWTFTPKAKAWRYSDRDEMAFYGRWVRQYHESDDQIERMADDLAEFLDTRAAA